MTMIRHMMMGMGGITSTEFQSFTNQTVNAAYIGVNTGTDKDIREQYVFNVDSNTKRMVFMVGKSVGGTPLTRRAIKYVDCARGTENWPSTPGDDTTIILASENNGIDDNIEGFKLAVDENSNLMTNDDGDWVGLYADWVNNKLFLAKRASGSGWGTFTKYGVVLDLTGSGIYIRHKTAPIKDPDTGRWWVYFEQRTAPAGQIIAKIRRAYTDDDTLETGWTLDTSWEFDPSLVYRWYGGTNVLWMPDGRYMTVNGVRKFYLVGTALTTGGNVTGNGYGGWYCVADSVADNLVIKTTQRPIQGCWFPGAKWNCATVEELSLQQDGSNLSVYYNGNATGYSGYSVGRFSVNVGAFDDTKVPALIDGSSLSSFTKNETGGITISESFGRIVVSMDGSQNQSEVEVLRHPTAFKAQDNGGISPGFNGVIFQLISLSNYSGGTYFVGYSNNDGSNWIGFRKGTVANTIIMEVKIGGTVRYSQQITENNAGKGTWKLAGKYGRLAAFSMNDGRYFENTTVSGGSWAGDGYFDVSTPNSWTEEDVYLVVRASNVSGQANTLTISDLQVVNYDDNTLIPFRLGNPVTNAYDLAISGTSGLSANHQTWTQEFLQDLEDAGILFGIDEIHFDFWDATNALKTAFQKKTMSISGTVIKTTRGWQFGGGGINTGQDLSLLRKFKQNKGMIAYYLYTSTGDTSIFRQQYIADDGTRRTQLVRHTNGTRSLNLNKGTANAFVLSGNFSGDEVITHIRKDGTSSGEEIAINGVVQSITGGAVSTGKPTGTNLWRGNAAAGTTPMLGEQGVGFLIGNGCALSDSPNGNGFDATTHAALNTAIRSLLAKILA